MDAVEHPLHWWVVWPIPAVMRQLRGSEATAACHRAHDFSRGSR
jgi:hypothetical protein